MNRSCIAVFLIALFSSSCGLLDSPAAHQLRIQNAGSTSIEGLSVLFPDHEVSFGDVPAGTTTEYRDADKGVYGYGAYRFIDGGKSVVQPVIDWVGETPLEGSRFTYTIEFGVTSGGERFIQLRGVTRDD